MFLHLIEWGALSADEMALMSGLSSTFDFATPQDARQFDSVRTKGSVMLPLRSRHM